MISRFPAGIVLGSALLLSACADYGGPISSSSDAVLSPQERRLQEAETKLAQLSRRMDALNVSELDQKNDEIREELRNLRGEIERLQFEIESSGQRTKDLFLDLDRRVQALEGGGAAVSGGTPPRGVIGGAGTVPSSSPGTLAAAGSSQATAASAEEERAYLETFDLLEKGQYDQAISGFKQMLQQWPQGRYADNGWYWMGDAQYVKRDYASAAKSFQTLVTQFQTSPKVSDGLLKLGLCQAELNQISAARQSLLRVVKEFPSTNAANLAKQKLDQLGG